MTKVILRITQRPIDADRINAFKRIIGNNVNVINENFQYGDSNMKTLTTLIKDIEESGDEVVVIEADAPLPLVMWKMYRQE